MYHSFYVIYTYLWSIFASIPQFGLPEEFRLIPALCRLMAPLPRPRDREISSRGRHQCFIFFSSIIEVGCEIYSSVISTSRRVLGAVSAAANRAFSSLLITEFIFLLLLRHFDKPVGVFVRQTGLYASPFS
jgi:hypothetical protein